MTMTTNDGDSRWIDICMGAKRWENRSFCIIYYIISIIFNTKRCHCHAFRMLSPFTREYRERTQYERANDRAIARQRGRDNLADIKFIEIKHNK